MVSLEKTTLAPAGFGAWSRVEAQSYYPGSDSGTCIVRVVAFYISELVGGSSQGWEVGVGVGWGGVHWALL